MKKSLFSYIFLIFLIITFLAGTYIYATGTDFVFKIRENVMSISDINNGVSEVVNQIDKNKISDLENALVNKYNDVLKNIGTGPSNNPSTPHFQQTRSSTNDYVLLSTNPYDFIPKYKTVRYLPVNAYSKLYIDDSIIFDPTTPTPFSPMPTTSTPMSTTSTPMSTTSTPMSTTSSPMSTTSTPIPTTSTPMPTNLLVNKIIFNFGSGAVNIAGLVINTQNGKYTYLAPQNSDGSYTFQCENAPTYQAIATYTGFSDPSLILTIIFNSNVNITSISLSGSPWNGSDTVTGNLQLMNNDNNVNNPYSFTNVPDDEYKTFIF